MRCTYPPYKNTVNQRFKYRRKDAKFAKNFILKGFLCGEDKKLLIVAYSSIAIKAWLVITENCFIVFVQQVI